MTPAISTTALHPRPTRVRYGVLAALCLVATIAYVQRNSISVAEKTIRAELGLSREQMGQVMSAFMLAYALGQLPSGWLAHIWGTRWALALFALVWSVLAGLLALAVTFAALLVVRFGMGAAQAGVFPCATSSIARWFPATRRGLASGALGSFMSVGSALGALWTGDLLPLIGWQWLFALYALPGIVWAVWFFVWFRDSPAEHRSVNDAELAVIRGAAAKVEPLAKDRAPTPWRALLTSAAMWLICAQQFFRAAAYMFFASWFPTYLQEARGLTLVQAAWMTSLPFWGVVVGGFTGGAISDWILTHTGSRRLSRQGLAIVSMIAAATFTLLTFAVTHPALLAVLFTASAFSAALAAPCGYIITIDMGGKHVTTVFSLMNMAGNLGAMLFPLVIPYLILDRPDWVSPTIATSTLGYLGVPGEGPMLAFPGLIAGRLWNWDAVILTLAGIYFAAAVCWALLNPNGTVFERVKDSEAKLACRDTSSEQPSPP
ncbi:MAG TPA: MFS transporter [Gemmataceae bacterium]|nr:MFS transporter [Gemmataceae bacterium]